MLNLVILIRFVESIVVIREHYVQLVFNPMALADSHPTRALFMALTGPLLNFCGLGYWIRSFSSFRILRASPTAPTRWWMLCTTGGPDPTRCQCLTLAAFQPSRLTLRSAVVLNLILEVALRCNYGGPGIGRPSPVLVVLEEAHRYLGDNASTITRDSANRIAREDGSMVLVFCWSRSDRRNCPTPRWRNVAPWSHYVCQTQKTKGRFAPHCRMRYPDWQTYYRPCELGRES